MVSSDLLLLVVLGALVGTYGTAVGAGGGFVLVPVLLLLYGGMRPEVITAISLTVVFVNAASGAVAYARMGRVDFRSGLMFAAAAVPGALLGASTTKFFPPHVFDLLLGPLLAVTGIFLIFRPSARKQEADEVAVGRMKRRIVEKGGEVHEYAYDPWLGIGSSSIVGFLSSILGIGGGIIHVPVLSRLLKFPVHIATATSHFVLALMTLTGAMVHVYSGDLNGQWAKTGALAVGAVVGAQVGAVVSNRLQGPVIIRALAVGLAVVGLRVVFIAI